MHVKTRSLALERSIEQQGRVIDERRWGFGSFAFAGQTVWITQQHFVGMLQARRIDQVDVYLFPFRMAMVLPLRTAWIADILSQASLRDVERQHCWKRGSGDGQRLWDYFTARLSDFIYLFFYLLIFEGFPNRVLIYPDRGGLQIMLMICTNKLCQCW